LAAATPPPAMSRGGICKLKQERSAKVRDMSQKVRAFACACRWLVRGIVGTRLTDLPALRSESRSDAVWYPVRMIGRQPACGTEDRLPTAEELSFQHAMASLCVVTSIERPAIALASS
jgi:hypothetical protein